MITGTHAQVWVRGFFCVFRSKKSVRASAEHVGPCLSQSAEVQNCYRASNLKGQPHPRHVAPRIVLSIRDQ